MTTGLIGHPSRKAELLIAVAIGLLFVAQSAAAEGRKRDLQRRRLHDKEMLALEGRVRELERQLRAELRTPKFRAPAEGPAEVAT